MIGNFLTLVTLALAGAASFFAFETFLRSKRVPMRVRATRPSSMAISSSSHDE
jgi:hypothetical protein